ncbi:MAG: lipoprotein LpqH [Arachnia sp.]
MHIGKLTALTAISIAALLSVSACTDPGANVPAPGQGTGAANASQPGTTSSPMGEPSLGVVETTAPAGGAVARIGDEEEIVNQVACTVLNGQWTMSGGDDEGAKVAVNATEDRVTVQSASVVLSNGIVASVSGDTGSATIAWDKETFTITGNAPVMNLNNPAEPGDELPESEFVITATCQS